VPAVRRARDRDGTQRDETVNAIAIHHYWLALRDVVEDVERAAGRPLEDVPAYVERLKAQVAELQA
jgi:hypothetical protein